MIEIVPRSAWGVPNPSGRSKMPRPCDWLAVHHEGGAVNVAPYGDDLSAVLAWAISTGRKWEYNYVVTPDGGVYEWGGEYVAAHSAGENSVAYGVLMLDNYERTSLPDAAVEAFRRLVAELQNRGQLVRSGLRITPHRDMPGAQTSCPGAGVIARWAELIEPWLPVVQPPTPRPDPEPPPVEEDLLLTRYQCTDADAAFIGFSTGLGGMAVTIRWADAATDATYAPYIQVRQNVVAAQLKPFIFVGDLDALNAAESRREWKRSDFSLVAEAAAA